MITVVQGGSGNGQNVRGSIKRLDMHQRSQEPKRRLRDFGSDRHTSASIAVRGTDAHIYIFLVNVLIYLRCFFLSARWAQVPAASPPGLMVNGRMCTLRMIHSSTRTCTISRLIHLLVCLTTKFCPMIKANLSYTVELNGNLFSHCHLCRILN